MTLTRSSKGLPLKHETPNPAPTSRNTSKTSPDGTSPHPDGMKYLLTAEQHLIMAEALRQRNPNSRAAQLHEAAGRMRLAQNRSDAVQHPTFPNPETQLIDKAGNIRLDNLGTPEDATW